MDGLEIGQTASSTRTFTAEDVKAYRQMTGDNKLGFAEHSFEEIEIVPGPLLGGMISEILGTNLPGRGTNWLKQHYHFLKPAYVGRELTTIVEITKLRSQKSLVNLKSTTTNGSGEVICRGESLVLVKQLWE